MSPGRRSVDRTMVLEAIRWRGQHGHASDCRCDGCLTLWGELEAVNKREATPVVLAAIRPKKRWFSR